MKKILFLIISNLIIFSSASQAKENNIESLSAQQPEKWLRLTCRGPVTPAGKTPIIYKDIMVAHFRNLDNTIPNLKNLATYDNARFQAVTDLCSERRWQQTDLTGWTGINGHTHYLDWQTDLLFERYTLSSVEFSPEYSRRTLGSPCDQNLQCNSRSDGLTVIRCNEITNTCENYKKYIDSAIESKPSLKK